MDSLPIGVAPDLPKYSRYKSVRRATAGDTQNGPTTSSNAPAKIPDLDRSVSRYRNVRSPGRTDRLQSVPALPSNYPPLAPLLRSNTAEQGIVPTQDTQNGPKSPSALNKAQQEAFDILTGKVDRQQAKLQRQVDQERAQREAAAETFRQKQKEEQAKREADGRAQDETRRKVEARRIAQRRVEEAGQSERRVEGPGQGARYAKETRDMLAAEGGHRDGIRRPVTRPKQDTVMASKSYDQLKSPTKSPRQPDRFPAPPSRAPQNTIPRSPTYDRAEEVPDTNTGRKLVKRHGPKHVQSAELIAETSFRRQESEPQVEKAALGPNFDAPKSAVNAGVRTVKVMYGEKSMKLPVTPDSTPVDLLSSAKNLLEYGFDPQRYVLQEYFKQLELQRPLRHYERVREVMNSWNSDEQHWFNIVSAATEWDSASLKYAKVPKERPEETTVVLYHSQRPRVWDKRSLTLRSDGQVVLRKHEGAAPTNVCHMSDFDVFMPTRKEMKELKAPRKYCFAVKSLQKPAMFLNTANFVHFISTKDQDLAMEWYKAMHGWRSWYLVHTLGLGRDLPKSSTEKTTEPLVTNIRGTNVSSASSNQSHQAYPGPDSRVLPDTNLVTSPSADSPNHALPRPFNNRGGPPMSLPRALNRESDDGRGFRRISSRTRSSSMARDQPPSCRQEPFAAEGLLGRTYTVRRQAIDNELEEVPKVPAFPGKPLVDLTAEKMVAPQFARKGHGLALDDVPSGGLVAAATSSSPEHTLTNMGSGEFLADGDDGLKRSSSRRTRTMRNEQHYQDAFTGGLLANTGGGQGDRRKGRGVAMGDRNATEPMLNMEQESTYAPGSLLRSVESHQDRGPVIQREKVREVDTRTGEAF